MQTLHIKILIWNHLLRSKIKSWAARCRVYCKIVHPLALFFAFMMPFKLWLVLLKCPDGMGSKFGLKISVKKVRFDFQNRFLQQNGIYDFYMWRISNSYPGQLVSRSCSCLYGQLLLHRRSIILIIIIIVGVFLMLPRVGLIITILIFFNIVILLILLIFLLLLIT